MKEQIALSPKYISIITAIFLFVVVVAIIFFRKNQISHTKEIKELIGKEINGTINLLEDKNRGSYNLKIGTYEIRSLPIAFEVQKYNIEVGDSVTKEANSTIMKFYKKKNGEFEKFCEYEIII